jgi:hypothetical protein
MPNRVGIDGSVNEGSSAAMSHHEIRPAAQKTEAEPRKVSAELLVEGHSTEPGLDGAQVPANA